MRTSPRLLVKCLGLDIPNDGCVKKIAEVCIAPRAGMFVCYSTTLQRLEHELQRNTELEHTNLLLSLVITQDLGPLPATVSPWMRKGPLTMLLERDSQWPTLTRILQLPNGGFSSSVLRATDARFRRKANVNTSAPQKHSSWWSHRPMPMSHFLHKAPRHAAYQTACALAHRWVHTSEMLRA
ncbi:hypothetical protein DFH29DRAFT_928804 [Suillus ampliporus]|nr:hypothetical protein DFH29DRAFT_928804 [Suillus ampliporus]